MMFRKYAVSYWSTQILSLVCMAGSALILAELYPFSSDAIPLCGILLSGCAGMILLCVFNPWNEKLFVDTRGITCRRGKRVLWSFSWAEIGQIRSIPVHRCRGYEIVPKLVPVPNLQSSEAAPDYTFEHSRQIAAALEKYAAHLMTNTG